MKAAYKNILGQYSSALASYLRDPKESSLREAHRLGREALSDGLSLQEMTTVHYQALASSFSSCQAPKEMLDALRGSERFFVEGIAPYEMTLRSFKESNAALQQSEERYRELFENASDIVFTTDLQGNFTTLNKAFERLTGYSRNELANTQAISIVAPEYQELGQLMLERKLAGKGVTTYELQIIAKYGQRIPLGVSTRLILQEGKPVGVQGIARDMTARKRAEKALLYMNDALEEKARRIAHELHAQAGQLLASVHIALDGAAKEVLPSCRNCVQNIKPLLDQIETQLRSLSHELRPTVLDDLGVVPALQFLAQGIGARGNITIKVQGSTEGRLPAPVEIALYRVAQEALTNVAKHAEAKTARVRVWREEKRIQCSVRDDGVGFDVRAAASQEGQRGLGLIGMRERVAAVRGRCTITSSLAQGTEVLVTIPLEV